MFDDEFCPPPECPVFEPTEEEFADPLAYINKIRPIAEKAGICKIRPPPHWQPPFAIDVENFKFTPRVQRINELGIHTRIRLQFIESVAKFWTLQGQLFKLPHVGGKALDLYGLHQIIKDYGGFQETCKNKLWNAACTKLHLAKNFGTVIKQHYERILLPYDIMKSGLLVEALESNEKRDDVTSYLNKQFKSKRKTMYKGSDVSLDKLDLFRVSDAAILSPKPRSKRRPPVEEPIVVDVSKNKELAKLQLYGAGPKMVGLGLTPNNFTKPTPVEIKSENPKSAADAATVTNVKVEPKTEKNSSENVETKPETKTIQTRSRGSDQIPYSIIDTMDNCKLCSKDVNEHLLLICDDCDDSFHSYCLIPPLSTVPTGNWRCPKCIAKECNKKTQAYGFEQARKQYTLQSFGEMADTFKSEYFTKPVHMIPTETVEKEFWRLVGSLEEDLTVEYGADIHVIEHGSGFPRMCDKDARDLSSEEEEYAESKWNLNNLPVQEQSLLRSVSGDISGMKVPWVYVGMCFSAFCWHIEDHWTYSINYMHWGEPKTWYGVPREDASKLESVMQESAPELFKNHPDLMHHLVTTMNPTTLMKKGVRVVRTNQCAGEFMLTFPRAYHAGFNQGYNFAEAVNFCPADWIPIGRECVAHYRKMKKSCVFSHEEIVCKVANNPERLDVQVAAIIYKDMLVMLQEEKELRRNLLDLGIVKADREAFELVPDDERQCIHCCTTCFLSALTCPCSPDKLVCIRHVEQLCSSCKPADFVLRYRYSLDELPPILHKLKLRAEAFGSWSEKVQKVLERHDKKLCLEDMKVLLREAESGKFPENDFLLRLKSVIHEAEVCTKVAQQLVNTKKQRTRIKDPASLPARNKCTLTLEEIQAFCKQIDSLPCQVSCVNQVTEYTKQIENFIKTANEGLAKEEPSSDEILKLLEDATAFDLDLPQIPLLYQALCQAKWLEEVREKLLLDIGEDDVVDQVPVSLDELRRLIEAGVSIPPRRSVERAMSELQELLTLAHSWEEKAVTCLTSKPPLPLSTALLVTEKANHIPVSMPHCAKLRDVVRKANLWIAKADKIQVHDYYPYVEILEALCTQANALPLKLEQLTSVESNRESATAWKERTAKTFLKKNTNVSLLQVLSPRTEVNPTSFVKLRRRKKEDHMEDENISEPPMSWLDASDINNPPDPEKVVTSFKAAELKELELLRRVRKKNDAKASKMPPSSGDSISSETGEKTEKSEVTDDSVLYCICRMPSSGLMLQCEVCHDWYHTSCVPLPKLNSNKSKIEQVYELKFICPLCHRTRRPHLSTILTLLLQLQKLPVRIQEGEALQCLTERAMMWQDRAKNILSSKECKDRLNYAASLSGSSLSSNGDEKLEGDDVICTIKSDAHSDPAKPGSISKSRDSVDEVIDAVIQYSMKQANQDVATDQEEEASKDPDDALTAAKTLAMFAQCPSDHRTDEHMESTQLPTDSNEASIPSTISSVKPSSLNNDSSLPTSNSIDTSNTSEPIVKNTENEESPNDSEVFTPASLNEGTKLMLEDLMLEGDLLEVNLPETQLIWKILQCDPPNKDENFLSLIETEKKIKSILSENAAKKRKRSDKNIEKKKPKCEDKDKKNKIEKKRRKLSSKPSNVMVKDEISGGEDEYAFCSVAGATNGRHQCVQPTGDEVNWLQCDGGCEEWFHCVCVQVTAAEARECEYICESCRNKTSSNALDLPSNITNPPSASELTTSTSDHFT